MVLIIAEVGVNHNGDLKIAKDLVDLAFNAGADIVKFQSFKANKLASESAAKAEYQRITTDKNESQKSMLQRLELSENDHFEILSYCKKIGIEFLSSPFDEESATFLNKLGLKRFKIPSGEITNLPYLRHVARFLKPTILSTGMSDLDEINAAISVLESSGLTKELITILHCTTQYPAPFKDVNLRAMNTISKKFKVRVGYSDHTNGIEVAIAAVSLGASVIEKHITLDKKMEGPDHNASLEPKELKDMIKAIRNIEISLGSHKKFVTNSEKKNRELVRKSIVAKTNIKKGDILSENNLSTKRPGDGISPMNWDKIIGTKAKKNYFEDEFINQ